MLNISLEFTINLSETLLGLVIRKIIKAKDWFLSLYVIWPTNQVMTYAVYLWHACRTHRVHMAGFSVVIIGRCLNTIVLQWTVWQDHNFWKYQIQYIKVNMCQWRLSDRCLLIHKKPLMSNWDSEEIKLEWEWQKNDFWLYLVDSVTSFTDYLCVCIHCTPGLTSIFRVLHWNSENSVY